jgi:hypothetical protein
MGLLGEMACSKGVKGMKLRKTSDGMLMFYCQGCEQCHGVNNRWTFNGDFEQPTFSPSILVRGTVRVTDEEAKRIMDGEKIEPKKFICHSFVENGKIRFLNDCTHELAGQTVELYEEERWFED